MKHNHKIQMYYFHLFETKSHFIIKHHHLHLFIQTY